MMNIKILLKILQKPIFIGSVFILCIGTGIFVIHRHTSTVVDVNNNCTVSLDPNFRTLSYGDVSKSGKRGKTSTKVFHSTGSTLGEASPPAIYTGRNVPGSESNTWFPPGVSMAIPGNESNEEIVSEIVISGKPVLHKTMTVTYKVTPSINLPDVDRTSISLSFPLRGFTFQKVEYPAWGELKQQRRDNRMIGLVWEGMIPQGKTAMISATATIDSAGEGDIFGHLWANGDSHSSITKHIGDTKVLHLTVDETGGSAVPVEQQTILSPRLGTGSVAVPVSKEPSLSGFESVCGYKSNTYQYDCEELSTFFKCDSLQRPRGHFLSLNPLLPILDCTKNEFPDRASACGVYYNDGQVFGGAPIRYVTNYIALKDNKFVLIDSMSKLRTMFSPIRTGDEAMAFIEAANRGTAIIDDDVLKEVSRQTSVPVGKSVAMETPDGFEVEMYTGIRPPIGTSGSAYKILFRVTTDGDIQEVKSTLLWKRNSQMFNGVSLRIKAETMG